MTRMNIFLRYSDLGRRLKSNDLLDNSIRLLLLFLMCLLFNKRCIVPYDPGPLENEELIIIEGLITDQHEVNTIKLSKSLPLRKREYMNPARGCQVWISDDLGKIDSLKETISGTYITDSTKFQGKIGRKYILHIHTTPAMGNFNYESIPMEMKPVPQIDSIYYEKKIYTESKIPVEGCQIYLDTHDPANSCNFYRWKYSETWEFHMPFDVINKVCWTSNNSNNILIKNTSSLSENRITGYPINSITNPIDRLCIKYSILVKQYSLNEDEYLYWERLKNISDQVGGLYDLIPAILPNNIYCLENQNVKTLGYFSVSAISSKRIFIKDRFDGLNLQYFDCVSDTIYGTRPIPDLPKISNNGIKGTWRPAFIRADTIIYTFTPDPGQGAVPTVLTINFDDRVSPKFTAAGPYCRGANIPDLPTTSNNGITGTWSPDINNNATTTYTFTPHVGNCANPTTLKITIADKVIPTFTPAGPYRTGATIPDLPTTSNNGITGVWSPAINNKATTTYTFTPDVGQCAVPTTLMIEISNRVIPIFTAMGPFSICTIITGLNQVVWVIKDHSDKTPPYRIVTYSRDCADCTRRGTNIKPVFWDDDRL
jgi:hypothetical protein